MTVSFSLKEPKLCWVKRVKPAKKSVTGQFISKIQFQLVNQLFI